MTRTGNLLEELIALAQAASNSGGIYATHMRDESNSVLQAIDEGLIDWIPDTWSIKDDPC